MDKENESQITPTRNNWVIQAYNTCPMTVPLIIRKRTGINSYVYSHYNIGEKLSDKRIIGVDCAFKIREGYFDTRCVFTARELSCPLSTDTKFDMFTKGRGAEEIRHMGKMFREENKE